MSRALERVHAAAVVEDSGAREKVEAQALEPSASSGDSRELELQTARSSERVPFARFDGIAPNSPAFAAVSSLSIILLLNVSDGCIYAHVT